MRPAWRALAVSLAGLLATSAGAALEVQSLAPLPAPASNNAVAVLNHAGMTGLASLMGLGPGKSHLDIHSRSWFLAMGADEWIGLPDVPGEQGRLAGVAARAGGSTWLFGGYTVAADGEEQSTPGVYRWFGEGHWDSPLTMPVPVDDATAHVYQDRFVYLVSGWHDLGNVNLVQVLDTHTMKWAMATPYPGTAVFGHAGGMSGSRLVVCGGVRIEYPADGAARRFLPSAECWMGEVDAANHRRIAWRAVPHHPGRPKYRMAAGGDEHGRVVFVGGTENPYNFDGVGYNGVPAEPTDEVLSFDLATMQWRKEGRLPAPSMDHRGLPYLDGWFYLVGGMGPGRRVSPVALRFRLGAKE